MNGSPAAIHLHFEVRLQLRVVLCWVRCHVLGASHEELLVAPAVFLAGEDFLVDLMLCCCVFARSTTQAKLHVELLSPIQRYWVDGAGCPDGHDQLSSLTLSFDLLGILCSCVENCVFTSVLWRCVTIFVCSLVIWLSLMFP